jgi:hypothetical protein
VASEVDICCAALSHIGDAANIASLTENSAQAEHCARFYPIARDSLLEMHDWGFATKRVALAQITNASSTWAYCYAVPSDLVNTISVLASDAGDDTSESLVASTNVWTGAPLSTGGIYTPQPFSLESSADGIDVLYTNQVDAVFRYVALVTDTARFSPLFTQCLGFSLGELLAGPIIKGAEGRAAAAYCRAQAFGRDGVSGLFGQAVASDAGQKRATTRDRQQVPWINGR